MTSFFDPDFPDRLYKAADEAAAEQRRREANQCPNPDVHVGHDWRDKYLMRRTCPGLTESAFGTAQET